jgi:primosomal protein N' (replication factor Y) (superfamily II helicase)
VSAEPLVEVALPLPVPRTFTYRSVAGALPPGMRVRVPFGRRTLVGWVVGEGTPGVSGIRPVAGVLDPEPVLTGELLALCRWLARYYATPLGQVIRTALPAALSDAGRDAPPVRRSRVVRLAGEPPGLLAREEALGRAPRQRACLELLEAAGGALELAALTERHGFSAGVVRGLVARGWAEVVDQEQERDAFADVPVPPPHALTPTAAQRACLAALTEAAGGGGGRPFLLRGVTGSGKTLVYIELLREVVERQGRTAIVLVPEIALTPQTVARFRSHFGDAVAVLHSGLSDGERYDAWRALRRGDRSIAVGARSAIFAPVPRLGAIVVDEEHEATYKQSEAPRYHARDVAVMRARLAGAVCLLGSATPALESWHNALAGKFRLLELPERVEGRPLPPVRLVDLRGRRAASAGSAPGGSAEDRAPATPILGSELVEAVRARLARGEQTILLLNRRGYSTFVQCQDCGHVWHCGSCNVSLTFHRGRRRLVCHHCGHEEAAPATCAECASRELAFRGVGTEQVERTVMETFPAARIARMDVDTTSGKWAHHRILARVEAREIDILLGTQMIAKGLDFPGVTLVGVVNADVGMNLPDFRATERTFQLLTQVAGRAGRGAVGGEVLVQTALPGHYAIQAALRHDFHAFAERELEERRSPAYPPHLRMANVILSGEEEGAVQRAAEGAGRWLRAELAGRGDAVRVTGPAPCPIDRIRGRWRWHLLLRSGDARFLGRVCRYLAHRYPVPGTAGLRLVVDRDPVALL